MLSQGWIQDLPDGVPTLLGALTSDVGPFGQRQMKKRKNWVPWGAPIESANVSNSQ